MSNKQNINNKQKKITLCVLIFSFFSCLSLFSQVTIGSAIAPNKNALLDLNQTGITSTKGMLMPRVSLTSTTSSYPMDEHVEGMVVYNIATDGDVTPGFYYNDGNHWIRSKAPANWLIANTDDEIPTSATDDIYHLGYVGIGDKQVVDASAILDINSSNRGILLPRVTLTSSTDIVTIANPTIGLLIYNTGENEDFTTKGYLYWDGAEWEMLRTGTSEIGKADVKCSTASLTPSQQIVGDKNIISGTILQISYTGSNGGSFSGTTLVSTGNSAVTAIIEDGILNQGSGVFNFILSGTPTSSQEAPNGIQFDLQPFFDANPGLTGCTDIVVGNTLTTSIDEKAVIGYLSLMTDNSGNDTGTQYYAVSCDSPDGKFSVRAGVPITQTSIAYGNQYLNVQVRNNQNVSIPVIWNYNTDYGNTISSGGVLTIPSQIWGGDNDSGVTWYDATGNNTSYGSYWGNRGIYDGAHYGPEYRRYTWIPQGEDSNVAYQITVMVAIDTTTPTTAVAPSKIKCYIQLTQVTATN